MVSTGGEEKARITIKMAAKTRPRSEQGLVFEEEGGGLAEDGF
jgi:hypothetical protein